MAGNEIIYTIGFEANTQNVAKQLETVQASLDKITQFKFNKAVLGDFNSELVKSVQSAANLKSMLKQATDVKTGKLNLTQFRESIERSGKSIKDYAKDMAALGPEGQQAFLQIANAVSASNAPLIQSTKLMNSFWNSLKRTAQFQISTSVYRTLVGGLSSAYRYAQNLNSSLNDIRIVTGQSAEQMDRFAKKANAAAKELRTTTTDYTNASLIFYQQGLSDEAVKERTDTTIKMANVTKDSAEEVSSYMTAIWNNFDDGSRSLESYADTITALGAATASSSAEIAAGLEKFASVADQIGLSYNYATSALATVVAQTRQSEDVVGTAFKTIFARIQGLNLGETQEDGTTLNQYSEALSKVGVNIKDTMGQVKDMDTILDETGAKWQALAKDQRIALAQAVAGTRQYTQFMALMDNWDIFKENLATAENAEGSLQQQADTYAESWDAARKKVQASMEGLYDSILDDKFFIKTTNAVAGLISMIQKFTDSLGGMKGVVAGLTALFTTVFKDKIASSISYASNAMKQLVTDIRGKNNQTKQTFVDEAVNMMGNSAKLDQGEIFSRQTANMNKLNELADKLSTVDYERLKNQVSLIAELEKQQLIYQEQLETHEKDLQVSKEQYDTLLYSSRNRYGQSADKKGHINLNNDTIGTKEIVEDLQKGQGNNILQSNNNINLTDLPALMRENSIRQELNKAYREYNSQKAILDNQLSREIISQEQYNAELGNQEKILNQTNEAFSMYTTSRISAQSTTELATLSEEQFSTILHKVSQVEREYGVETNELIILLQQLRSAEGERAAQLRNQVKIVEERINREIQYKNSLKATEEAVKSGMGMTNLISNMSAYYMALTQTISTLKIMKDDTADVSSKIAAFSALIMFSAVPAIKAFTGTLSLIKKLKAGEGLATALEGLLGVGGGATLIAALPYLIAIATVLGTIYAIYKAFHKERDSLKDIQKNISNLSTQIEEAKNKSEELKNNISSWEDARDSIDNLTEGTQAFVEALQSANDQALALLQDNPDLWEYMYTDKKGRISFKEEGLEKVQENNTKALNAMQRMKLGAQQIEANQKVKAKAEEIRTSREKISRWFNSAPNNLRDIFDEIGDTSEQISEEDVIKQIGKDRFEQSADNIREYIKLINQRNNQSDYNSLIANSYLSDNNDIFEQSSEAEQNYISKKISEQNSEKIKKSVNNLNTKYKNDDDLIAHFQEEYGDNIDTSQLTRENMLSELANKEVYSEDDIEKQVEELKQVTEGLQQASKDLGLSENALLQAASGDVSELENAVGTTLPSKIKDLEKGVKDALKDELTPEIEDIFNNYDPTQVINNIMTQMSNAFDAGSAAIYDFLDNGVFSDENIATLKEKFQGIFDFSNFENLSTYDKIESIGEAQELTIKRQKEALEDYKKSYQSFTKSLQEQAVDAIKNKDFNQFKEIQSSLKNLRKTLDSIPTLEDQLKTKEVKKNLETAVAHLKSYDSVAEKVSKKGKIEAKDFAAVLDMMPELARYMELNIEKGYAKLNSEGMKKLQNFQKENKQAVIDNSKTLLDQITKEQEYYGALVDYINTAKNAETNRNKQKVLEMSDTVKKAYEYFGAELAEDLQKNFDEQTNATNTAQSQINDSNQAGQAAQEQAQRAADSWDSAFQIIAESSATNMRAVTHNMLTAGTSDFAGETGTPITHSVNGQSTNSKYEGWNGSDAQKDYSKQLNAQQLQLNSMKARFTDANWANRKILDSDRELYTQLTGKTLSKDAVYGDEVVQSGLNQLNENEKAAMLLGDQGNTPIGGSGKDSKGKSDNSKTPDRIDKKELEHYTEVNKLLERQDDLLSELDTQISRTFGLKQIDEYEEKIKGISKTI